MTTEQALQSIPSHLNWIIGKGRTRPDEPIYVAQLIDPESGIAVADGHADEIAIAVQIAVRQLPA